MTEPRHHHILPEFYLAGFTDIGTREGLLHVFDYERAKTYRAKPGRVASERDFYRVYEPNEEPNTVERSLARLESEIAPVLRQVLETGKIHSAEELGTLRSLAALIHARGRRARERLSLSIENTIRTKIESGIVTREQWENMASAEIRAGLDPPTIPPYEKIQELIQEEHWQSQAPQVLKVGLIPEVQQILIESLIPRIWSLARADLRNGGFICSDTPLTWGKRLPWQIEAQSERLDDLTVPITFPLSKEYALITREDRQGTYAAVDIVVAWVNTRTQFSSLGTLYSAGRDFLLLRDSNQIGKSADYFTYVEQARKDGIERP